MEWVNCDSSKDTSEKMEDNSSSTGQIIPSQKESYTLYTRRWFILAALSILNLSNALIWLTFAPVAYQTRDFYGTTLAIVNMLSVVFMITGIPCGIVATWLLDTLGLRVSLILGSWLNVAGAVLRIVSAIDGIDEGSRLPLVFIGQTLAALAQPFILFAPTKLAALWFPDNQRATANMITTMCNPLGIMLANILSPLLAPTKDDLLFMLGIESIPAIIAVLMTTFGMWSSTPPTPPSASAAEDSEPFLIGVKKLFRNKIYWILALAVGGGIGLFSVLTTLLVQMLCPWGYTDNFAGVVCASAMIGAGLVGAAICGVFVDYTKRYTEVVKICFVLAVLALIAFAVLHNRPGLWVPIAFACGIFGLFGLPVYPIGNELSVETTYPIGEATSSGILFMFGQIQGIVLVAVLSVIGREMSDEELKDSQCAVEPDPGQEPPPVYDMSVPTYVMTGYAVVICVLFVLIFKTKYRRLMAENSRKEGGQSIVEGFGNEIKTCDETSVTSISYTPGNQTSY